MKTRPVGPQIDPLGCLAEKHWTVGGGASAYMDLISLTGKDAGVGP